MTAGTIALTRKTVGGFVVPLLALMLGAASAGAPLAAEEPSREDRRDRAAREYFTDVELVDQHGETHRLFSDLMDDKVVVIDSVFTNCTGMCPILSKTMAKIQERAGERLGRDVHLLTITVDPENDDREAMAEMAERFGAREGWYFLTGEPENVRLALQKLGQWVEDPETHQGLIILGNQKTGLWKKALGLAAPEKILAIYDSVAGDTVAGDTGPEAASGDGGSAGE